MKHAIFIILIAFVTVGLSAVFGESEHAGLFGAIIGVGVYAANSKSDTK